MIGVGGGGFLFLIFCVIHTDRRLCVGFFLFICACFHDVFGLLHHMKTHNATITSNKIFFFKEASKLK